MRILLASPPITDLEHVGEAFQPVGLNCLERYLFANGYKPQHEDYHKSSWDHVDAELNRIQPDVVGITVYTHTRAGAEKFCAHIRKLCPDAKIILGGHHAAFMTQQVLENWEVDAIVPNEGEVPFLKIVQAVERNEPLDGLPGLAMLHNGEVRLTPAPPPVPIDELPIESHMYEDRTITHKEAEFMSGGALGPEPWQYRTFWMTTTRGCPYHCTFCSVLGRSSWRMESPTRVVDRMQLLHDEYNCRFLTFGDSSFNIKPGRVIEICDEIVKRKLKIRWFASGMRANKQLLPEPMVEAMARAGCALICFGAESGSREILKTIRKNLNPMDVDRAVSLTQSHGIHARVSLMIGNPGESDETINQTLALLDRVDPSLAGIAIAQIYPGSELFTQAKQLGYITDEYWADGNRAIPFFPSASYATTMRWYNKIRFRKTRARGLIGHLYGARAGLQSRFGIALGRGGVRFGTPPPPLFCDMTGPNGFELASLPSNTAAAE